MALAVTVTLLPAAVPVVASFVVLHPVAVYPVFGVILGVFTLQFTSLFWIVHVPLVDPISSVFVPFENVNVITLLVIAYQVLPVFELFNVSFFVLVL